MIVTTAEILRVIEIFTKRFHELLNENLISISVTTDSQTSEEDSIPPPLPVKHRDSDYGNTMETAKLATITTLDESEDCYQSVVSRPLPVNFEVRSVSNTHYEVLEIRKREETFTSEGKTSKKNPPTPPPKPARGHSRGSMLP